jgi:hypothetical protein|tara:strand:- start:728 stop:1153 length:426 start_codon:yes stop_codon:yes gene_type:complete
MTLIEQIYNELNEKTTITTDEFSMYWLGQCKSYYTSIKSRNIQASNNALINLLNKINEEKNLINNKNPHPILQSLVAQYNMLEDKLCKEIAERSIKHNICNSSVKKLILKAVNNVLSQSNTNTVLPLPFLSNRNHLPIVIL